MQPENLSGQNIERQKLERVYESAIMEKTPEGRLKAIRAGLRANGKGIKDMTPELERLFNSSLDELTN